MCQLLNCLTKNKERIMSENPLKIASVEKKQGASLKSTSNRREETKAKFERLWLVSPHQFDPMRNAIERLRISRTFDLIKSTAPIQDHSAVDLGCGSGTLSFLLRDSGAIVTAVDIAQNALKLIEQENKLHITTKQEYVPKTTLEDNSFDLVIATELINYLQADDYRLFFSELARLITDEGYVICSTPVDFTSEDAVQRLADLAATEFDIEKWSFSYHMLYIKLRSFLKAPKRFTKGARDKSYRKETLSKRQGISKLWYRFNSTKIPAFFWRFIAFVFAPLDRFIAQSKTLVMLLEKISKALFSTRAISHVIFIAKRRPFIPPTESEFQPREIKHKKQVWE